MWNKRNLQKWIKDLRSTKTQQGQGTLRRRTSPPHSSLPSYAYCCLGRVSEISRLGRWKTEAGGGPESEYVTDEPHPHPFMGKNLPFAELTHLTPSVAKWLTTDAENFSPVVHVPPYLHFLLIEMEKGRQQEVVPFDIPESDGEPFDPADPFSVASLNDHYEFTFGQIADCLEYSHYRGLI